MSPHGIKLTVKGKTAAFEVQLLKYLQILTFLENKGSDNFLTAVRFSWTVAVGEVQEKGKIEQNISYELRLFYSSYYTADTSNGLVWYDLFQICTIHLNF